MGFAYVGSYTTQERKARGRGLKVYSVDDTMKTWKEIQLLEMKNPSYLSFNRTGEFLYSVHGDDNLVTAFKVDAGTGKLTRVNQAAAGGYNPVFISLDVSDKFVFVASLNEGTVSTLPRNPDGSVGNPIFSETIPGKKDLDFSFPHQCLLDGTKQYVFVPAQGRKVGYSCLSVFKIGDDGRLVLADRLQTREYAECRHVAIHPNNRFLYLLHERGCAASFNVFDENFGKLEAKQIVTTLPESHTTFNMTSAILVSPNGRFLYVSNRGHNSVAVFTIDPHTGYLHHSAYVDTLGKTPRFMTFAQNGRKLVVGNEDSDTIRIFDIEEATGRPIFSGSTIETGSPACILFSGLALI